MRILHVTPYAPAAWAYGGIPRLVGTLARELGRRGHQITICATDACDATTRLTGPRVTRLDHGVTLRTFPNLSNGLAYHHQLFLPVGLNAYLREHAGTFDVAHLHACRNAPGAMAAHHLRRAGVPYVLAPNGTAPRLERRKRTKRLYDGLFGDRILRDAACILAVSHAEQRQLEQLGVAPDGMQLVPNPIDLDEFKTPADPDGVRPRLGLSSGPLILFLGKLTPRKRVDDLIRAAALLGRGDWHLVIAGNDMGAGSAARARVRALGIEGRTHFTGLLRGQARLDALAAADVVVYPSADEIFGLVPLEALLCGTPVIVADDSGCGEIIAHTGGGQVVALGDVPQLTAAIARVLEAPSRWRTEAANASARVRAAYGPDVVCDRLEALYAGVVAGAAAGSPVIGADAAGVSFVVPVHNGAATIRDTLNSIFAQADGRPMEVIAVDDRGIDASSQVLRDVAATRPLRIIAGAGRGAAAAINVGILAARFPIICQVDQDVVLQDDWMRRLVAELNDPTVAAAQGHYIGHAQAGVASRVMARDLEQRYAAIPGRNTTHVCTGNSVYRAEAVRHVGFFDETLGYGYDNDMSYRLREAGYRLTFCRQARSVHHWREGVLGYLKQQYGFGYGRLDLVRKHPARWSGDSVSPIGMMAHPLVMGLVVLGGIATSSLWALSLPAGPMAFATLALLAALALERAIAGVRAAWRFRDMTSLWFPVLHLGRDLAWVAAIATWLVRRIAGRSTTPAHSMRPRSAARARPALSPSRVPEIRPLRVLGLIPAHNEAASLSSVVTDVRMHHPDLQLLVVDDGSSDGTVDLLERLDVRWLRLPERMGVGSAMRAGLRYAARQGFDAVIRLDGDGQHGAEDIERLLTPIRAGAADVVLGSRFVTTGGPNDTREHRPLVRLVQRALGGCLSMLTGHPVTDPTSGFCAFGPRAVRLLAEHHPTGYPEPELRLFLSRNALTAVEVPVLARPRQGGTSSLTAVRVTSAGARILLALIIVPLREAVRGPGRD